MVLKMEVKMSKSRVIASEESWIEGEALRQLDHAANLPGMVSAVGLPDLHPGKGIPVGAAFLSKGIIYPHLVGNDIGCGMGLWVTDQKSHRFKIDKAIKKLHGFEEPWDGDSAAALEAAGLPVDLWPYALGTIGSGNHFAEFQTIDTVINAQLFDAHSLSKDKLYLLVHSGSRGLGEHILRKHVDRYAGAGLAEEMEAFQTYIQRHDQAVNWAELNRQTIAYRFLDALGLTAERKLDVCHNSVTPFDGGWLHRKGAAPADKGLTVIPGSRGTLSYLVRPNTEDKSALLSLAHGAGRKWKRSDAKTRLSHRYKVTDLVKTKLGGRVICEDKALIYEEAPQAYKDISQVILDMENHGLIEVIATLKPIITYKTRRR
jgi:release factor H-coupled RctB family protein